MLHPSADSPTSQSKSPSSVNRSNSSASNPGQNNSSVSATEEDSRDSGSGAGEGGSVPGSSSPGDQGVDNEHNAPAERIRRLSSSMMDVDDTTDPVRIKCRELITKALLTPRKLITKALLTPRKLSMILCCLRTQTVTYLYHILPIYLCHIVKSLHGCLQSDGGF